MQWQIATVKKIMIENPRVKTFTLQLPDWTPHFAGQHYDVRLTAPDGYQAQRSYSIASPPEQTGEIDLTVEWIEDGEISAYFHEFAEVGTPIEMRGPIGGYFVWKAKQNNRPLFLVAGGSGVVPLMSMLRHRKLTKSKHQTTLLFSIRTPNDIIYQDELENMAAHDPDFDLQFTFTRQTPADWEGYQRRIDRPMLEEITQSFEVTPMIYICGPTALVENVANHLVAMGFPTEDIRTERFGPTGV